MGPSSQTHPQQARDNRRTALEQRLRDEHMLKAIGCRGNVAVSSSGVQAEARISFTTGVIYYGDIYIYISGETVQILCLGGFILLSLILLSYRGDGVGKLPWVELHQSTLRVQ